MGERKVGRGGKPQQTPYFRAAAGCRRRMPEGGDGGRRKGQGGAVRERSGGKREEELRNLCNRCPAALQLLPCSTAGDAVAANAALAILAATAWIYPSPGRSGHRAADLAASTPPKDEAALWRQREGEGSGYVWGGRGEHGAGGGFRTEECVRHGAEMTPWPRRRQRRWEEDRRSAPCCPLAFPASGWPRASWVCFPLGASGRVS